VRTVPLLGCKHSLAAHVHGRSLCACGSLLLHFKPLKPQRLMLACVHQSTVLLQGLLLAGLLGSIYCAAHTQFESKEQLKC
jgi:hypothetical protein